MAGVPYAGGVPEERPDRAPAPVQQAQASADAFGAAVGRGAEAAAAGMFAYNAFYDTAAVDDQVNQLVQFSDRLRKGDPTKTSQGPNGEVIQMDTGYMGTKGQDAMRQREPVMKQLDDAIKQYGATLRTPQQKHAYEMQTRRMRSLWLQEIGGHANRQSQVWMEGVNNTGASQALRHIANYADDDTEFKNGEADFINFRVKAAETVYGAGMTDQIKREVIAKAKADAIKERIEAVATRDPARAMNLLEENRDVAGANYPEMYQKLRARNDAVEGPAIADQETGRTGGRPAADQVHGAIIRQESGGNPNVGNSTDGAVGIGQIMPDTFKQWAKPGEDINNPRDNYNVSRRMIDHYYKQYNGDAARVAVAYFSGPGNVAPEGSPTPWKKDHRDGNGKSVSSYVADIQRRLGDGQGGMRGPLPPKSEAFERILQRTVGNPGLQQQALAHMNRIYAIYQSDAAQLRADLVQRQQDTLTEANRNGAPKQPLVPQDFVDAYGGDTATAMKAYDNYSKELKLYADKNTLGTMTPDQVAEMVKRYEPQPGAEGFAQDARRANELAAAYNQIVKERDQDPAAYALARLPAVQEAYRVMTDIQKDNLASPEQKQQAAQRFAEVTMQEQGRVGVHPADRAVLPKAVVQEIGLDIMKPAADGQPANIAQNIEKQAQLWGRYWPQVYRQIQKDASPVVRVLGSGVKPQAASILTALAPMKLSDILKDDSSEKDKTIKDDVLKAFKPFASTLMGQADGLALFNDFRGQAEKLAAYYVVGGMTSSDAATKAFEDMLGFKYTFYGSNGIFGTNWNTGDRFRVPKSEPTPMEQIVRGSQLLREQLKPEDFAPPRDTIGGLRPDYLGQVKPNAYRDAVWVTAPGDVGLMLVYNDQAVRSKDGQPFIRTWEQLGAAAKGEAPTYFSPFRDLSGAGTPFGAAAAGTRAIQSMVPAARGAAPADSPRPSPAPTPAPSASIPAGTP